MLFNKIDSGSLLRLFGSFFYFFLVVLIADIIWPRRFNRESLISLYGIAVVYVGLAFLGYLFPLVDIHNTTKRGFFKLLPIILLYLGNSGLLLCLSGKISKWADRSEK